MATNDISLDTLRTAGLDVVDPAIAGLLDRELDRQRDELELIASENFTWPSVMEAVGSVATNKYAEGYPGKRYYGGCGVVDEIETLAIERAKSLYGAEHANVQPHAGHALPPHALDATKGSDPFVVCPQVRRSSKAPLAIMRRKGLTP